MVKEFFDKIFAIFSLRPFFWVVLFVVCILVLFLPDGLLKPLGLDGSMINGWPRTGIGFIALITGTCLICGVIQKAFDRAVLWFRVWRLREAILKMIEKLSYQEKILLYTGLRLNMATVYAPLNNSIAQTLVSKSILKTSISIADPMKYPFSITTEIWEAMIKNEARIFPDLKIKSDQEIMRELKSVVGL